VATGQTLMTHGAGAAEERHFLGRTLQVGHHPPWRCHLQFRNLTWTMLRQITTNSVYNHTYARRPLNAKDPFFAFWADGDPTQLTPSRLYFGSSDGTHVWQLPYDMPTLLASPQEVDLTIGTKDRWNTK